MDTEIWISYDFHLSLNIILFIISNYLKMQKLFLTLSPHKYGLLARFGLSAIVCQPLI